MDTIFNAGSISILTLVGVFTVALSREDYPKLAPYENLRWVDDLPRIEWQNDWLILDAIDGTSVSEILTFCRRTYGDLWQKRFVEDLVEVLTRMGHPPEARVDLTVRETPDSPPRKLSSVAMTREKRQTLRRAWRPAGVVSRGRTEREASRPGDRPVVLSASQVADDLNALREAIANRYAYRDLRGFDFAREIERIKEWAREEGLRSDKLAVEIVKLMARFGDAHSGASMPHALLEAGGFAPFLLGETHRGWVAFRPSRDELVDEDFPYVVAIDGLPLKAWFDAAAPYCADGSPQYRRFAQSRFLRFLPFLRRRIEQPASDWVVLELRSPTGETRRRRLRLVSRRPNYGVWPAQPALPIPEDVGYLHLSSMRSDASFLQELHAQMERFRDTAGLIIDVRGNGGGSRDALRTLLPYVLPREIAARVVNVAKFRRPATVEREGRTPNAENGNLEGYLANRHLYPATSSRWSSAAKEAIAEFSSTFQPEWNPPASDFSDWHFMVLEPPEETPRYEKRVVVLLDSGCFSATDIFLGAFKGLPNVRLVGTASAGGSARSAPLILPHSKVRLRLASMASFQPSGKLYDGNGVPPDINVSPDAEYFLGFSDPQLEAALRWLRTKPKDSR